MIIGIVFFILSCNSKNPSAESAQTLLWVENPTDFPRKDVIIPLDLTILSRLSPGTDWPGQAFAMPCQLNDPDRDGQAEELLLLMDLDASEKKQLKLEDLIHTGEKIAFPKRTQAELSHKINGKWEEREYIGGTFKNVQHLKVPKEHTDHSWFIRYEGPGWESDKVGYRFYLDWRNATDIFGKKTPDMILQQVGLDGFDSYHEPADWGMDILKVGNSLGIGSIAMWVDGKAERVAETDSLEAIILSNGNIQSAIRTLYHGWSVNGQEMNMISDLSIDAGSRMTHHQLQVDEDVPNLCTGIVKLEQGELVIKAQKGVSGWGYLATYGTQSLADDRLGMAIIFQNSDLIEITEDEFSHVVVLKPRLKQLDYYFTSAWEQEPEGITSKEAFLGYLDQKIAELNKPVKVILDGEQ